MTITLKLVTDDGPHAANQHGSLPKYSIQEIQNHFDFHNEK
jgi:hypothetical protein